MGSMHTGLEEMKGGFEKLAEFYRLRASGGVGLMITGGISPNFRGRLTPFASDLTNKRQAKKHQTITKAVHDEAGKICMQILHAGRYAYHPFSVSATNKKSPITPFKPSQMSERQINITISHFGRAAKLAKLGGYDGVEIMGSEGYLINQFLSKRTNQRSDGWGGSIENRCRFAENIVKEIRANCGDDFIIIFRISLLDLVEGGLPWQEVETIAKTLQQVGVDIFNSGIGWHESRVPTIASSVPPSAFAFASEKLKQAVNIPVVATNRINTPEIAESILASKQADMVCLARPFLADPDWVIKAENGQAECINTCIACNQACLDHVFKAKRATCLVNPQACYETELVINRTEKAKKLAVVGAGPAGMAFAKYAAEKGHQVTLFDQQQQLGGQFNLAATIPGKEDYAHTVRYFTAILAKLNVDIQLGVAVNDKDLNTFDEVILATGIKPRKLNLAGIEHSKVVSYLQVLQGQVDIGKSVAVIGAGGIGVDVSEFLSHPEDNDFNWHQQWGVDTTVTEPAGLQTAQKHQAKRQVHLLQRKQSKIGKNLGKTTSWIHRQTLKDLNVKLYTGVEYLKIDDDGLHYQQDEQNHVLNVDHIVICAGQESNRELQQTLLAQGKLVHLIGGADLAAELDAKRAIRQAAELAAQI